jgi:hypothetical protein
MVNISNQFNTQYVPFFLTFPPHSGHTLTPSPGWGGADLACAVSRRLGPGLRFANTSGSAVSNFCKSYRKVLAGTPASWAASSILICLSAVLTDWTFSSS